MHCVDRWLDALLAKPLRYLLQSRQKLLRRYVANGATVLDAGCGSGEDSLAMATLVGASGRVVAVDTDREAITKLRKRAERRGLTPRIDARVCTDTNLGTGDLVGRVDFALAVYVFHHAADPAALLRDIHAALTPGKPLLIVEPRHQASPAERRRVHAVAGRAGFGVAAHPTLPRDWAVELIKR